MPNNLSCGPLLIDIEGTRLSQEDMKRLSDPLVGGVIFFARNYEGRGQLSDVVKAIRDVREDLLLCVDQEGGRVQRFREGFTRLPAAGDIASIAEAKGLDKQQLVHDVGFLMAYELREIGFDFSFAPVADIDYGRNTVIGRRAYGTTPLEVSRLAGCFYAGMKSAGMAGVAKHFPGHGYVNEDTHVETAVDRRSAEELEQDLEPFKALIGQGVEAVMPAHVVYQAFDSLPAVQSKVIIETLLRGRLGFEGCVISDDLGMTGASEDVSVSSRVEASIKAGCDLIMTCNNSEAIDEALETLRGQGVEKLLSEELCRRRGLLKARPVDLTALKPLAEKVRALILG
ncbi:beta-N-acetylhexosaminidase [Hahella sp. CCB-MM4]|uniref:beta-N-acetylhexosaminidase n=1 Tax=Hahella sp. (strain CCB-MM4) TaxID=1926491 RepID=UPI000B9BF600|nr:beta-N-acetylhexosaminidase [Hahella sp. CCB-MM4]OZG73476.1 beta-N-acetylhexosaminidase [Hahella sp. CCB-MM4]